MALERQQAGYSYFVNILQGEFCVELSISFTGLVRGKILKIILVKNM